VRRNTSLKRFLGLPERSRRLGPFVLVRQLGRGGFAPVWLAREVYGDTEVRLAAIKLFAAEEGTSTDGARAFGEHVVQEARALCQVEHPNVVRFYSIGSDEAAGVFGVAMEYLNGTALDQRLNASGALPLEETLLLGSSIASALAAVHRAGLLHRDVKPANIVDAGGTYKLIDFGIAFGEQDAQLAADPVVLLDDLPIEVPLDVRKKLPHAVTMARGRRSGSGRSGTGYQAASGGTMGYVDPATVRGELSAPSSDLYALGVVLFECVVGRHPAAVAAAAGEGFNLDVLEGRVAAPKLREVAPDAPAALAALVDSLLQVERSARPHSAEWVAIELERIRGEREGGKRVLPPEEVGPFRGLGRFEVDDRDVYFGRSSEVAATIQQLRTHGVVALVGPSGSGKSSLARAGVLPRVAEGSLGRWPQHWVSVITAPGRDATASITSSCAALDPRLSTLGDADASRFAEALGTYAKEHEQGVVILIDQLEELVTVSSRESRRWVGELLTILGQAPLPGVRVLVTARRDLLDPLLAMPGLGKVLARGSLFVEPMTEVTLLDVLQRSLEAYGYALEDDALADDIAADLRGAADAMPLVQFALSELWQKRDTKAKRIPRAALWAIGGIAGSLERHADATIQRLAQETPGCEPLVRDLLLRLTTPQGTRRALRVAEVMKGPPAAVEIKRRILERLEKARLVVRGADEVTLAHEALLTQWRQLRGWVEEARDERQLAEELERDAARWSAEPDLVAPWRKRRLAQALAITQSATVSLSAGARRFLDAGRRAERRARVFGLAAAMAGVALVGVGAVGYINSLRAEERSARERAAFEESKATLEQQKRVELERAQGDLTERQRRIDELMQELTASQDPETIRELARQMSDAQSQAHAAEGRIGVVMRKPLPATTPASTMTPAPATAEPSARVRPKYQDD
jgi:serine/threonine protein kinase/SpoVK/Ycf46/Vps4 family AAA+-type ATPase